MFYITSKILAFLIKPIIWIFFLLLSALITQKKGKKILMLTILIFYFFTNGFIADEVSRLWELPRNKLTKKYDIGIVLGGIADYDKITKAHNFNKNSDRLIDAEQLYHKGIIKKIMICGGNGNLVNDGIYKEADAIKQHLLNNKIPSQDIIIENKSRNTIENALNAVEILNRYPNSKFLLITSAVHMRRAKLCFNKANIEVTEFPTDCTTSYRSISIEYLLIPRIGALEKWEKIIHEWVGYAVYKINF